MALVLLFDPWAMVQAGFWLSFVAVAVLFALPKGVGGLSARTDLSGGRRIRRQWLTPGFYAERGTGCAVWCARSGT